MPQFFASTATGLAEPLEQELKDLGFEKTYKISSGVFFETNWAGCYKANLCSRLASRILKPVQDFIAYQEEELYNHILDHDFTKYISPDQTFKIEASIQDSKMRDQRMVAMKVKDAIADQFRAKYDVRPSIDNANPDLRIYVKAVKNSFHVMIDTSGESLFMRGYRKEVGDAPLKENLAAGLLFLSGWDRKSNVIDPTCGSGTILIEAALMALNIAPGTFRKSFGFQKMLGFQEEVWNDVLDAVLSEEKETTDIQFFGYDIDRKVIAMAKQNARSAGVDEVIQFQAQSVTTLKRPIETGMVICNPPFGERLGELDNLRDVYRDLAHTLKTEFKGWDAWILSGNKDLIGDLKLKSSRKFFLYNGPLECRFLRYSMN